MTSKLPIGIELHGSLDPDLGVYGNAHDVSEYLTSCSFTSSIMAPWETINLDLSIPLAAIDTVLPGELVSVGKGSTPKGQFRGGKRITASAFWVVIRDTATVTATKRVGTALAWGKVDSVTVVRGVDQSSGGHYCEVSVTASSWANMLNETQLICTFAKSNTIVQPSFLSPTEFFRAFETALKAIHDARPHNLGRALSAFWNAGLKRGRHFINFPDSLFMYPGSKTTATEAQTDRVPFSTIPIVYNSVGTTAFAPSTADPLDGSAYRYAPSFAVGNTVLTVPGGIPRQTGGFGLPGQTWWSALTSMFTGDPECVELFPILDVPEPPSATDSHLTTSWEGADNEQLALTDPKYQHLVRALGGSRPAVLYRMKPFVTGFDRDDMTRWFSKAPVGRAATAKAIAHVHKKILPSVAAKVNAQFKSSGGEPPFQSVDYENMPAYDNASFAVIYANDIFDYTETADDVRIVNGAVVYPNNLKGPAGAMAWGTGMVGDPVIHHSSPYFYGIRMHEVTWPFLGDQKVITPDYFAGLTEMIYSIVGNPGHEPVIMSGSANITYRPRARAGHWYRLSQKIRQADASGSIVTDSPRDPTAHEWTTDRLGYAHSITHTIGIQQGGEFHTSTQIEFERLLRASDRTDAVLGAPPVRPVWPWLTIEPMDPFKY